MNLKKRPYKAFMWILRLIILFWRMIHNAGQYGDEIVNFAPISDCGATNTFWAFLNSIM
jgi:hypothetical protein